MKVIQLFNRINAVRSVPDRDNSLTTMLGVTIAFSAGSLGVFAFLVGLSLLGFEGGIVAGNAHLFEQGLSLVGYAVFAGLLVDCLRFLGDLFWRETSDSG